MFCASVALSDAMSAVFCCASVAAALYVLSLCCAHRSAFALSLSVLKETPYFFASSLWLIPPPIYSALMAFQSALIAHHPFNGATSLSLLAEAQGVEPRYIGSKPIALPLCYASIKIPPCCASLRGLAGVYSRPFHPDRRFPLVWNGETL